MVPFRFGRLPSPPDARDYRIERFLPPRTTPGWVTDLLVRIGFKGKVWDNPRPVLNQGDYGTCVGNGCAQWGNTSPVNDQFTQRDARALYYQATIFDGSPDNPDAPNGGQQGATVRSGAKALQTIGRLRTYAFTTSLRTIKDWLLTKGPLIVGTIWTEGMFEPNARGYVRPTGAVVGGHCYLLIGYNTMGFTFLNSWGERWGTGGRCHMRIADFAALLAEQGEVCAAVELPL